ncbi:MBOAT family O-acyltransferase [Hahella sp. NBU794]|uniref:MBOAT family O-acyltransferase n=1 Tax=Hahella sp. NBU794 TaxID=3422590 RepID=UPI003D6EF3FD
MLFNSNEFLFVFLPLSLLLFYLARRALGKRPAFIVLFILSLGFYGWWEWRYLPLLIGSLATNLWIAERIRTRKQRSDLVVGLCFNLGLLAVFKYLGFIEGNIEALFGIELDWPKLALPIGISFYTFQQIAFLVDVARSDSDEATDPARYGLFVSFFPQLIAGPIVHHKEMMNQFEAPPSNDKLMRLAAVGLAIFAIGLAKKTMIADPLGAFATPFFARATEGGDIHFFIAWAAALAYTFQIYFDFCGYSEMAIGLAMLFGVKLPANFNSPYKSRSIIDFWRRWHMTLSRFLRDYLYFPLGGGRVSRWRRYINLMIVMLVGGLWHGASWTFVIWGGLHGSYLMINHGWRAIADKPMLKPLKGLISNLSLPITFFAVVIAWVVFRAESFDAAMAFYNAMFGFHGLSAPEEFRPLVEALGLQNSVFLFAENYRTDFYMGLIWTFGAAVIAFFAPSTLELLRSERPTADFDEIERSLPAPRRYLPSLVSMRAWSSIVVGVLLYISLRAINAAAETEFLYFQF